MFSINLPGWLGTIIGVLAGGVWPKEIEGDFAAVSDIWAETSAALGGFSSELDEAKRAMAEGLSGPTAEQFAAFIDSLQTALPQMQQGSDGLSRLAMETALNIQYAKLMMLSMLVVTAATIAELAASLFGAAAIPAVEAAAEVALSSIARQLVKQVLKSAAEAAATQTAIDSGIQLFQYLKYGKQWNWKQTVETAGLGGLGGGLGAGLGIAAIKGLGEDVGNHLISHMAQGAIVGAFITELGNEINGIDSSVGLGAAGGAIGGAISHGVASAKEHITAAPKPGGYDFKAPTFGDGETGGETGGGLSGGKSDPENSGDTFANGGQSRGGPSEISTNGARSVDSSANGGSAKGGSVEGGAVTGGSVEGGAVNDGSAKGGSVNDGSTEGGLVSADPVSGRVGEGDTVGAPSEHTSVDPSKDTSVSDPSNNGSAGGSSVSDLSGDRSTGGDSVPRTAVSRESGGPSIDTSRPSEVSGLPGFDSVTRQPQDPPVDTARAFNQPADNQALAGRQGDAVSTQSDASDTATRTVSPDPAPPVRESSGPAIANDTNHTAPAARLASTPPPHAEQRSAGAAPASRPHAEPPNDGQNGGPRRHDVGGSGHVPVAVPAPAVDHALQSAVRRHEQWQDDTVEIQQHFTDRFDYTVKTERVADDAEAHLQSVLLDRTIYRSRGVEYKDLSQAGHEKVLGEFQADAKAAFDERFGTPGDGYDTAVDHMAAFHDDLESLARELPARLDREALWEQQRDLMQQRFNGAFDAHTAVAPRRELFGRQGAARIDAQRNEAWQHFEPELRDAFDDTAAHTAPTELADAVSERFDQMMRDEVPRGIALHDQLLTEVSTGRAAVGDEHSPALDAIGQRITSEFESVFGKPFAPRPADGRTHQDEFSANDRWTELKQVQRTDWLPKAVALGRELGADFNDRLAASEAARAAPRAELGLGLTRPTGSPEHGLTYTRNVGPPSENPYAFNPRSTDGWLHGGDISDAGLDRVRSAFAGELAAAFHNHFDDSAIGHPAREAEWQAERDALFHTRLPELLEYEAAYELQLNHASREFEDSYEEWDGVSGHLSQDGIDRVRAQFDEDFRDAYDQIHGADPARWHEFGGIERAWQAVSRRLLDDVEQRFEAEEALVMEVSRAADRFDRLGNAFTVPDEQERELGAAYRTVTVTRYDKLYGDGTRDVAAWLHHEQEHGDAFGTRLTNLSEERGAAAAAAAAERTEAERAAAEATAAHAAEAAGQPVERVPEEPSPESGPEKLRRLTVENESKLEDDVQQLTRLWQEKGHTDSVVEQATRSWSDTVRREFDSAHSELTESGKDTRGGNWDKKYESLLQVANSEQWVGVHKQVGDALSVLDAGLKQRAEAWSGSRYADWQREQLADAGRQLTSRMRSELGKQLDRLGTSRVDAVADDTRRRWTADAVTKGFDDVITRLQRKEDTSPVLLASLATLRSDTVAALDAPGHAVSQHQNAATEAEQWPQTRAQIDAQYAEKLNAMARLESNRPDADGIYQRIIGAGPTQPYEGRDEYERMLPGPEEFRQAYNQIYDQTFEPTVRTDPGGKGLDSMRAEQQWDERRSLLENTLRSRVRLASKQMELAEEAARTAQSTRERWISRQAADEKIIDATLDAFRANQQRLFHGSYGRLDSSGTIDVNAPYTYQYTYHSLIENLDEQLASAVTKRAAEKAVSASAAEPDLEGLFVEAVPKLRESVEQVVRDTHGLDEHAAESLVKSSIVRADAVFQRIAGHIRGKDDAGRALQQELDDVVSGTKAVAEFRAAVSEQIKSFQKRTGDQLPVQAAAHVGQWADAAADAKFDQLLSSGRWTGQARLTALSRRLREALTEVGQRLEFEAGARQAMLSAMRRAEENLRASDTVLDPDSVQRLRFQHLNAAHEAAEKGRVDLASQYFDPEPTRQAIEEFDDTMRRLADGVRQQVLVETKLTSALTDAGNGFAALTDAHMDVPLRAFEGAAKDYRRDYVTAFIRTLSDKPLDAPSWLDHEAATADRFGAALHAQVREMSEDWQFEEQEDDDPWRKSTFSPDGPGAACVEAASVSTRPFRYIRRLPAPSTNG